MGARVILTTVATTLVLSIGISSAALSETAVFQERDRTLRIGSAQAMNCLSAEQVGEFGFRASCRHGKNNATVLARIDESRGAIIAWQGRRKSYFSCKIERRKPLRLACERPGKAEGPRKGLVSPFPSTINGLELPNAHRIWPMIWRSMAPALEVDFQQLRQLDVASVLIFKNWTDRTRSKLMDEKNALLQGGMAPENIHEIEFPYRDFSAHYGETNAFHGACVDTVTALQVLEQSERTGEKTLVHCTVGEDRTGYLMGLYGLLKDPKKSLLTAFEESLCEYGYGSGNPNKPQPVVAAIRTELTPLFLKMGTKIRSGKLRFGRLTRDVCVKEPRLSRRLRSYQCAPSTRFRPLGRR